MKYYSDVLAFHEKFGLQVPDLNSNIIVQVPADLHNFRALFLLEELDEYVDSWETRDLAIAIDSLIDLVYVTIGTALVHGLRDSIFEPTISSKMWEQRREHICTCGTQMEHPPIPEFLNVSDHNRLKQELRRSIRRYRDGYIVGSQIEVIESLNSIFYLSMEGANHMGFNEERWDILWDDVQRANMQKERVLRSEDSKRGSTYDVRKPEGWVAPRSKELVDLMILGKR